MEKLTFNDLTPAEQEVYALAAQMLLDRPRLKPTHHPALTQGEVGKERLPASKRRQRQAICL
jgi:hypothetical protein